MTTVAFAFLGCKVNRVDTETMRRSLAAAGFFEVPFGERADVAIVNTCTVTGRADRQSRQLVHRARRANPDGLVVCAGCLPSREGGEEHLDDADLFVPNARREELAGLVIAALAERGGAPPSAHAAPAPAGFGGRARAYLKVQDGCDCACAYCIVPAVRGPSRSVPLGRVLSEARLLAEAGYNEIVLTGIHLGDWGKENDKHLAGLCRAVEKETGVARIRLSSIEPGEIGDALIAWLAESPAACHHLHVPLQSGDEETLRAMNRTYTPAEYADTLARVVEAVPDVCLGADVLAGFPGETDGAFGNTFAFVESLPLAYLHVFPYSPREGTAAYRMAGRVPDGVAKTRAATLRDLSALRRAEYAKRFINRTLDAIVEKTERVEDGWRSTGLTRHYLRVSVNEKAAPGALVDVEVTSADAATLRGELV